MTLTNDQKKHIMNELLGTISYIIDENYQKRVWILAEGPEVQDFDEAVCCFSDIADGVLEDYKDFGITDKQYRLLTKFRDEFMAFSRGKGRDYPPEEFIFTPEWVRVRKLAKEVLEAFNYP